MKSYHHFCGLARALDRVGGRWTLLLIRELLLGPRRYSDLLSGLPGITSNLLAARLRQLVVDGIVERVELGPPRPAVMYRLTDVGWQLEPSLMALGAWGERYLDRVQDRDQLNWGWAMVSLKRRFRAGNREGRVVLEVETRRFSFELSSPTFDIAEISQLGHFDLRICGSGCAFRQWLFLGHEANRLVEADELRLNGDVSLWPAVRRALDPPRNDEHTTNA